MCSCIVITGHDGPTNRLHVIFVAIAVVAAVLGGGGGGDCVAVGGAVVVVAVECADLLEIRKKFFEEKSL